MGLIIAILNDGTIMASSKDRVKASPLPDSWKLKAIFATGIVLGSYMALTTVNYPFSNIDRIIDWGEQLQMIVLELIKKVCRNNKGEKGKYIKIIISLLSAKSVAEDSDCQRCTLCKHTFYDLAHISPVVFMFMLTKCYYHGNCKATVKYTHFKNNFVFRSAMIRNRDQQLSLFSVCMWLPCLITKNHVLLRRHRRHLSHRILTENMDVFYAAVKSLSNPTLKGKSMFVDSMSMLSTVNYEAMKFGLHSAMPGVIAQKLCPELVLVPTNFRKYTHYNDLTKKKFC